MRYRLLYFVWILPAYLIFLIIQQGLVYKGTIDTYQNGVSLAATVIDFDIKQIAAQSNGYVIIRFKDPSGNTRERKLSLSIQMAQQIMESQVIPIRYQADTFQDIVMIPTYSLQKSTSLMNMAVAFIGLLALVIFSVMTTKFAHKKLKEGDEEYIIERVDL